MAYTKEQWERAKGYYEAGLSLSKITDKTTIARNTISQRAKREQWEHGKNTDYIEAKEIIAIKKGTISDKKEQVSLMCADEVADENIRYKRLIFGNAEKLAGKITIMTDQVDTPNDVRTLVEANDKLAVTLKVADRHSNQNINVNTQNNLQQNNIAIEWE